MIPEVLTEYQFIETKRLQEVVTQKSGDVGPIFLIEGDAGAGKTTFAHLLSSKLLPSLGFSLPHGDRRPIINTDMFQYPRGSEPTKSHDLTDWFRWGQSGLDGGIDMALREMAHKSSTVVIPNAYCHSSGQCDSLMVVDLSLKYLIIEGYFAASKLVREICQINGIDPIVLLINTTDEDLRIGRAIWRAEEQRSRSPDDERHLLSEFLDPTWELRRSEIGIPDLFAINEVDFVGFVQPNEVEA